jgi:hypothetical protein
MSAAPPTAPELVHCSDLTQSACTLPDSCAATNVIDGLRGLLHRSSNVELISPASQQQFLVIGHEFAKDGAIVV